MIFDQPQQPVEVQDRSAQRLSSLTKLIAIFEASFSSVHYRILESISAVNARVRLRTMGHLAGGAQHRALRERPPELLLGGVALVLVHQDGEQLLPDLVARLVVRRTRCY